MTKKKVQRTDWKKEFQLAITDRNYHSMKCEGLREQLEEAEQEIAGQSRLVVRLEARASKVGEQLAEVTAIANQLLTAPQGSFVEGETIEHGRDVLLGMLIEKLRKIERPVPF